MSSGRVLILNGSHSEIPLIDAAHEVDVEVITTGLDPSGQGHLRADRYVPMDFSDAAGITRLAEELDVDGVLAGCNDFAAISAAKAAHALGLPGHDLPDVAEALHHKDRFRALMKTSGLQEIRATSPSTLHEALQAWRQLEVPVLLKPVDLSGGKGIMLCESERDVESAWLQARERSKAKRVVVEEFLAGSQHGFTCFIRDQCVYWWFADDEQYFLNPFLVAGTSAPSTLTAADVRLLIEAVERLAEAMDLVDGLVHVQSILTANGPRLIEVCRRCPGDLYPEFVRLSSGQDYAGNLVGYALGRLVEPTLSMVPPKYVVRNCSMASTEGIYVETRVDEALSSNVVGRHALMAEGSQIADHLTQKTEIVFLEFESREAMDHHLENREHHIEVVLRNAS